jgi:hypothetical protein
MVDNKMLLKYSVTGYIQYVPPLCYVIPFDWTISNT